MASSTVADRDARIARPRALGDVKLRLISPAFLWLCAFFAIPLCLILLVSLSTKGAYGGVEWRLSLGSYARLLDPLYMPVFWRSLALALGATFLCAVLAFPISYWMARLEKSRQNVVVLLVLIPFWTNILVRLYAWMFILGRSGLVNSTAMKLGVLSEPLEMLFNQNAVLLGLVYGHLPFMILPLYAALEKIDWQLVEAAHDLYASSTQAFLKVILPLSRPGLVAGSILVFTSIPCDFATPDLLGGAKNMLVGNLIQQQYLVVRDWPFGSALSLVVMLIIGCGIMAYMKQDKAAI